MQSNEPADNLMKSPLYIKQIEADLYNLIGKYDRYINNLLRFGTNDLPSIYKDIQTYGYLFTPETYHFLENCSKKPIRELEATPFRLQILRKVIIDNLPLFNHFSLFTAIHTQMQTRKVKYAGEKKYLGQIFQEITSSPSPEARRAMSEIYMAKNEKIQQKSIKIYEEAFRFSSEIGYSNPIAAYESLHLADHHRLYEQALMYLERTTKVFISELDRFAEKVCHKERSEVHMSDFWYYFRGEGFVSDDYSSDSTLNAIFKFTKMMGLELKDSPRAIFDLKNSPNKSVRAFCGRDPLSENNEVVVVCNTASNNPLVSRSLLHELGHMIHYLNMDSNLEPIELNFGENEISELIASIFESLLNEPEFMSEVYGLSRRRSAEFVKNNYVWDYLVERYNIHRYCFFYEVLSKRKTLNPQLLRKQYESQFSRYFGFVREGYDIFRPNFSTLESMRYLRSNMVAKQIQNFMKEKISPLWWKSLEAGKFLIENFISPGYSRSFDTLIENASFKPYSFSKEIIKK